MNTWRWRSVQRCCVCGLQGDRVYRWFSSGLLPVGAASGSALHILQNDPAVEAPARRTLVYARVSSADQRSDLIGGSR